MEVHRSKEGHSICSKRAAECEKTDVILRQILLLFNESILPERLSLKTLPGLQWAGLCQLNSQRLA